MPLITCGKTRDPLDPAKRTVIIQDGDATGKNIVIVDDLVQSGGTLFECGKRLIADGASSVSAFVTHAVFPNQAHERFMKGGDFEVFRKFYVTDSRPNTTNNLPKDDVFEVLELLPQIMKDI